MILFLEDAKHTNFLTLKLEIFFEQRKFLKKILLFPARKVLKAKFCNFQVLNDEV